MTTGLPLILRRQLATLPAATRYLVAFSGGADSMALLHGLTEIRSGFTAQLLAVHVDHGLHPAANHWTAWCARRCQRLGLDFASREVSVAAGNGESLEAAARHARYAALAELMRPGDILLMAHHQDDQAETLLLHLLRGSGLAGLAAMPESRPFGPGLLARPLLGMRRQALRAYLEQHDLDWIEDPSNEDLTFDRNYLRNALMPSLLQRWPGAAATLSRTARHCAEANLLLRGQAAALLPSLCPGPCQMDLQGFARQPVALRHSLMRAWLRTQGCATPNARQLERLCGEMVDAAADRNPLVAWSGHEMRRYRDRLYLLKEPLPPLDHTGVIPWRQPVDLSLPGNGLLRLLPGAGGLPSGLWRGQRLEVRYRKGGEECRLLKNGLRRPLKKLLQEAGIPPWLRYRQPLIYLDGRLAMVPGVCACDVLAGEADLLVQWVLQGPELF